MSDECRHQTYWTGHKDDPCPYCQIAALTAERDELKEQVKEWCRDWASAEAELSRYRQGVEINEYVSKAQTTWRDDGTTYSEGIITIPKEFIGQRVRVIVMKEEK